MNRLEAALARLEIDLRRLDVEWALVGGLAVSVRAEPRTTRDIDVGIAVPEDSAAEELVRRLQDRGYQLDLQLEHETARRLAGVRLYVPEGGSLPVPVDLLFASSGIEPEIVEQAERIEVFQGVAVPVARAGHLLVLKALAGRMQDVADAHALLRAMSQAERDRAREAARLVESRGFQRGKSLSRELEELIAGEL